MLPLRCVNVSAPALVRALEQRYRYQDDTGATGCLVCEKGSYSINVLSCELCQVGEYCPAGSVVGTPCPPGSTTDGRGATGKEDCGCYAGLYDASGSLNCLQCSQGMNCTAANTAPQNLPVAAGYWRQHYWSAPPNGSVRACFTETACLGGTNLSIEAFCAPSQQGPYCAVCRDGYFGGGDGKLCEPCDGHAAITFLPSVVIGMVMIAMLAYAVVSCYRGEDILKPLAAVSSELAEAVAGRLEKANAASTFTPVEAVSGAAFAKIMEEANSQAKDRAEGRLETKFPATIARVRWLVAKSSAFGVKLKILIALFQMLQGIGITFYIQWPDVYAKVLRILAALVLIDLPKAMPIDCIANFGFLGSLVVRTALPLLLILLLAAFSKGFRIYGKEEIAGMLSSGWFVVLFLVYPSCSSAVFQAFMCDEMDDGSAYLRVDYSMRCYAENKGAWDEEYIGVMVYAILMSFIYPLGTPLLYVAVLYANRDAIAEVDRLERLLPVTEARPEKFHDLVRQKIRQKQLGKGGLPRLTGGYEMRVYWFEVFECVRKICLVGLPIFLDPGSSAQLIVGLLVCFISYGMYASYKPYTKGSDGWLSKVCQVSLFFSLVSSIALKMEHDSSTEALGVLLLFMLMVPPAAAFLFESELDFEKGCNVSKLKEKALGLFARTVGRCFDCSFRVAPRQSAAVVAVGGGGDGGSEGDVDGGGGGGEVEGGGGEVDSQLEQLPEVVRAV